METTANTGCEDNPDISILTGLLSNATALLEEIEEMVDWCSAIRIRKRRKKKQSAQVATIRQDGETLVIDGFRFEDAASVEELKRLSAQGQKATHD